MRQHEAWFAAGGGKDAIRGYISTRGAMAISAILTSQSERGVTGSLAEIGTFLGKTFIGLVQAAAPTEKVVGLDIFEDRMDEEFMRNLKANLPAVVPKVQIKKADSTMLGFEEWAALLGAPARFVHVDGDHTYAAVRHDVELAASHLAPDGVVVIDDFLHEWYPDVTEGILDALRSSEVLRPVAVIPRSGPLTGGGTKLVCAAATAVEDYDAVMAQAFKNRKGRTCMIAGHPAFAIFNYD